MEFDFSTNVVVETLDKVPAQFQGAYVENEDKEVGGFTISPAAKPLVEAISGLGTALSKARKEAKGKTAPNISEILAPLGVDSIEAAQEMFDTMKAEIEKSSDGKINLDKMRAGMQKEFDKLLQGKDSELGTMSQSLHRYLIEKEAVNAIASQKGVTDLLLPHIKSQTKVIQDGTDFVVRVLDSDGEARGDGKGGFMSVTDLVAELKVSPTFGRAFESEAPRGGGSPPASPRPPSASQPKGREMSATEKIASGLRNRG